MEKREWLIIICIAVITPVLVALGVSMPGLGGIVNDTSQWIGFWGGYIGSIFGGLITLFVLQNVLTAQAINDKNTAWNAIAVHVVWEVNAFNEKVTEFYLKNIK